MDVYVTIVKPFFDKLVAAIVLLLTLPILLVSMFLLAIVNRGKVWFCQPRPGKHNVVFKVLKFKTMTDARDSHGVLLSDDKRLTTIGKIIRKTSMDELPQLINVLKGEMSIVGPRPLLVDYLPLYSKRQSKRHDVRPGITGWAQINGRNAISWKHKFELDVWYVEHISFTLDIKILFRTFVKVIKAEGVNSDETVTMERFTGDE
jgi:undecaprenyl phosphate N,N'-diacetylbacillosamine 1-phosphate transferase